MKKDPVLDALQKASKGLRYTSETDAPLQPFVWANGGELTPERLADKATETTTLDAFFPVPCRPRNKRGFRSWPKF